MKKKMGLIRRVLPILSIVLILLGISLVCFGTYLMRTAMDKLYYLMNYSEASPMVKEQGGMDKLSAQAQYFSIWGTTCLGISGVILGVSSITLYASSKLSNLES